MDANNEKLMADTYWKWVNARIEEGFILPFTVASIAVNGCFRIYRYTWNTAALE